MAAPISGNVGNVNYEIAHTGQTYQVSISGHKYDVSVGPNKNLQDSVQTAKALEAIVKELINQNQELQLTTGQHSYQILSTGAVQKGNVATSSTINTQLLDRITGVAQQTFKGKTTITLASAQPTAAAPKTTKPKSQSTTAVATGPATTTAAAVATKTMSQSTTAAATSSAVNTAAAVATKTMTQSTTAAATSSAATTAASISTNAKSQSTTAPTTGPATNTAAAQNTSTASKVLTPPPPQTGSASAVLPKPPIVNPKQERDIQSIVKQLSNDNASFFKSLEDAQKANPSVQTDTKHQAELKSEFQIAGQSKKLQQHKFKNFILLKSEESLGKEEAAGSYKAVYKLNEVAQPTIGNTGKTLALAIAQPSASRIDKDKEKAEETARKSAESEAYALTLLKGMPGVVQLDHVVFYMDKEPPKIGLLMQFANAGDLKDYLSQKKNQDELEKLNILSDVAGGIASCHEKGITHSDIKPANILLHKEKEGGKERMRAVVSDFGFAFSSTSKDPSLLPDKFKGGTQPYLPPEHFINALMPMGKTVLGPPIDAFAFGITMHKLVYGEEPPWIPKDNEDLNGIKQKPIEHSQAIAKYNTEKLGNKKNDPYATIIAKLLDPDPTKRMTMKEAKEAIDKIKAEKEK